MSLVDKILAVSKSNYSSILSESEFFHFDIKPITTDIPIMNIALSGKIDGGLKPGILQIAGESKHFKTLYGLNFVSEFLNEYQDGVCVFYDTEGGSNEAYFDRYNIDTNRVIHTPITSVEQMKTEISNLLDMLKKEKTKQNVIIFFDSLGNLASKKEIEDAIEEKSVADMTRAKQIKSLFRIINMDINLLKIPMIVINHTYKSQSFISTDVVSSGTGAYYNSNDIWIVKRKQHKDSKELKGYEFKIVIEKSRFVKEKSEFPINVYWEDGIHKYSGLSQLALESKIIKLDKDEERKGKPKIYRYKDIFTYVDKEDIDETFWQKVLKDEDFTNYITNKYKIN